MMAAGNPIETTTRLNAEPSLLSGTARHSLVSRTVTDGLLAFVDQNEATFNPVTWQVGYADDGSAVAVPVAEIAVAVFTREFPSPDKLDSESIVHIIEGIRQFNQAVTGRSNG